MARIVKMEMEFDDMDVNDTSERELVMRNLPVGKYIVGRCNAWEQDYMRKNNRAITSIGNYVCGLLHRKYNIEIDNADDVRKAQDILQKEYGLTIIDCFNRLLDGKSFFPDVE
jgi:phage gp29-like protein